MLNVLDAAIVFFFFHLILDFTIRLFAPLLIVSTRLLTFYKRIQESSFVNWLMGCPIYYCFRLSLLKLKFPLLLSCSMLN